MMREFSAFDKPVNEAAAGGLLAVKQE